MSKSISQSQAEALAEGFLDNIGEDFKPTKSLSKIIMTAGYILDQAQKNLNKVDRVASGKLSESMQINNPREEDDNIIVELSMLFYWKFIDEGVKGYISQTPNSPYSFKNLIVSKKMLANIKKWLTKEGLKANAKGQGKSISKREKKRFQKSSIKKNQIEVAAYAISKSVKAKGLKKTNFLNDALNDGERFAQENIGKGFKIDVKESIPKNI